MLRVVGLGVVEGVERGGDEGGGVVGGALNAVKLGGALGAAVASVVAVLATCGVGRWGVAVCDGCERCCGWMWLGLLFVEIVECGGDESGGVVGGAFVLVCCLAVACISGVCGVAAVGESASRVVGAVAGPMHAPAMGAR